MKKMVFMVGLLLLALPVLSAAETWKNVSVIDGSCLSKVKADPDKHTKQCAMQCSKGGYGLLTSDGTYLKFDESGNEKALSALKASEKTDHLRATVVGKRDGESVKVESIALD